MANGEPLGVQPTDFDSLWDYHDPAETERRFRALFDADPGDDDTRLQLLTQIARAQGLQGKFEDAHRTLDLVTRRLNAQTPAAAVRCLLERGRVYNNSDDADSARDLFLQALDQAQTRGLDGYAVDAAHMIAIVSAGQDALSWNLKALALAERSSEDAARRWFGSLYNNLGWTYYDLNDTEAALEAFRKAESWYRAAEKPDALRIARYSVAFVLRVLRRIDEALTILRELEASGDGFVYEELAECLLLTEGPTVARPYFQRAYQTLSADAALVARESGRVERLRALGSGLA